MTDDLIAIIGCSILGLIAHGAKENRWLEWVLRVTYCLFLFGEFTSITNEAPGEATWTSGILISSTVISTLLLFKHGRLLFSYIFTFINQIVGGRVFLAAAGKLSLPAPAMAESTEAAVSSRSELQTSIKNSKAIQERALTNPVGEAGNDRSPNEAIISSPAVSEASTAAAAATAGSSATAVSSADAAAVAPVLPAPLMQKCSIWKAFFAERVFVPESIPHMNALWIYVTCMAFLLTHTEPGGFQMPAIMIPIPVAFDQLFSYNFFGLVLLAVCGAGIFVRRNPREVLQRLGLVKPSFTQVLLGIAGIFVTFAYDYLWSTYTHSQEGMGYADKLTHYNEGTFGGGASPGSAFLVASATGLCAGLGEETLIRGALQPVFGILPAALMHGVLHGQFSHAPLLILQVFGWSMMMGILRRYTNTTTTIITHVGFNFLSTFLFSFNP